MHTQIEYNTKNPARYLCSTLLIIKAKNFTKYNDKNQVLIVIILPSKYTVRMRTQLNNDSFDSSKIQNNEQASLIDSNRSAVPWKPMYYIVSMDMCICNKKN